MSNLNGTEPFFFLKSDEVRSFVSKALAVEPGAGMPYHNYFAFNFYNDQLHNAKIYFSFFRRLENNEVKTLLPYTQDFEQLYHLWQQEPQRHINHTGCAFAIKVGPDLKATYQFHFRFPYNNKYLSAPGHVTLSQEDLSVYQGLSYEYTGDERVEKRYFYLRNSPAVMQVLKKFNEPFRNQVIEYTETDKMTKIIHWFESVQQSRQYFRDYAGANMNALIDFMHEKFGCVALYPGVYENKKMRSVYFFKPNTMTDRLFYDPQNNRLHTVENVLVPHYA